MKYKLLTPGPLTTSDTVKQVMMFDHCTWDDEYKAITQRIRSDLLALGHVNEPEYTCVLMQGSGTFGVESVLNSAIQATDKLLILSNGAYGERMADMAARANLSYRMYACPYDQIPSVKDVESILQEDEAITHIAMVHSETTSGILNDISSIGALAASYGKSFIVDAMSSFGGVDIPLADWHIDFLISSANKCIQGVPGFSFILAKKEALMGCKGCARTLSLDLYDQWNTMQVDGKWRFTSPTHVVLAFAQAMKEMQAEGGIPARSNRYRYLQQLLVQKMAALGFRPYLKEHQGPIITTFYYPENSNFAFEEMYHYIKEHGYAIYPGKLMDVRTFRIGNIGEIYESDILRLYAVIKQFLKENEDD